jgi:hypothetical protein
MTQALLFLAVIGLGVLQIEDPLSKKFWEELHG